MAASACGLRPGTELTMLAKALLNLDEVARTLDPDIRIDSIIESHAAAVMRDRMLDAAQPAKLMRSALDAAAFVEQLPGRLNKVLESLAEGRIDLRLDGLDEGAVIRGAQKMANRVAAGVMIAAFVITAALFASAPRGATSGAIPCSRSSSWASRHSPPPGSASGWCGRTCRNAAPVADRPSRPRRHARGKWIRRSGAAPVRRPVFNRSMRRSRSAPSRTLASRWRLGLACGPLRTHRAPFGAGRHRRLQLPSQSRWFWDRGGYS